MTGSRKILVAGAIAFLLCGSLYDTFAGREHWPFSNYPMFSRAPAKWTLTTWRLYGVDESGAEIGLLRRDRIAPFDPQRLYRAFRRLARERGEAMSEALADTLDRYERRRLAGQHDGPPLVQMRLYELRWEMDPYAANIDRPDRRLVAETAR